MYKCPREDTPDLLTPAELCIIKDLVKLMSPAKQSIRAISGKEFQKNLAKASEEFFQNVESNLLLACATILDPRFKRMDFELVLKTADAIK